MLGMQILVHTLAASEGKGLELVLCPRGLFGRLMLLHALYVKQREEEMQALFELLLLPQLRNA